MSTKSPRYVMGIEAKLYIAKNIFPKFTPSESSEIRKMAKELETLLGNEPLHPELSKLIRKRNYKIMRAHSALWKSTKSKGLSYHSDGDLKTYYSAVEKAFDEFSNSYVPIKALQ